MAATASQSTSFSEFVDGYFGGFGIGLLLSLGAGGSLLLIRPFFRGKKAPPVSHYPTSNEQNVVTESDGIVEEAPAQGSPGSKAAQIAEAMQKVSAAEGDFAAASSAMVSATLVLANKVMKLNAVAGDDERIGLILEGGTEVEAKLVATPQKFGVEVPAKKESD